MSKETQTSPTEYEVGTEFIFNGDLGPQNAMLEGLSRVVEHMKLETRMLVFDALHGTHYRAIRHDLVEQEKRRQFEASIGLIATGKRQQ